MYKIAKENLSALFQSIAENQELYLPVEVSGQVNYKAWTPDAKVSLETLKTVKSPNLLFKRVHICFLPERAEQMYPL